MIALWFACEDLPDHPAGKVVAMATDDLNRFALVTSHHVKQPVDPFLDKGKLWRWEPSHLSTRIVAQQSVFVCGTGTIDETRYESIQIAGESKRHIREALHERFGLTAQQLFSDFPGFALSHGHARPYRGSTAGDYLSLGLESHQQGDSEQAKEFYDRALELAPRYATAYGNRGLTRAALGDLPGAIADYDQVLELDPQYAVKTYGNRGLARAALGDLPGAIADYDRVLELNPHSAQAHNNRGNAKAALEDHTGAIADYDRGIELDPHSV